MVGLPRGKVKLEPYSSEWQTAFSSEAKILKAGVSELIQSVHHVGSTAIPGMLAKPLIDMLILSQTVEIPTWTDALQGMGYEYRENGRTADSIFFAKGSKEMRTHHLRITQENSDTHMGMIFFRDKLIEDDALYNQYFELKKELAMKYPEDRGAYTFGKEAFISQVLTLHPHL